MPRLPTMRVMGSHAISTSWPGSRFTCDGSGMIVVIGTSLYNWNPFSRRAIRYRRPAAACTPKRPHLPGAGGSGGQFRAAMAPLGFFVDGLAGHMAQAADHRPVQSGRSGRQDRARRLVHERHELIRAAGHRAADADATDVRAAADPVDPSAFGHVALDDGTPA